MSESESSDLNLIVDHLFRHEAGKMVAVLTRLFGFPNIEQAEDIVQETILKALESWKFGKIPENPQAWLYTAAKNKAIDAIRRKKLQYKIEHDKAALFKSEYTLVYSVNEMFNENEIKDSQLRMMFACCHPEFSKESQLTLILKTLCGFSTAEIAKAFITGEDTVSKRLYRTKETIRQNKIELIIPSGNEIKKRIEVVLNAIYLLFNEGYNSTQAANLIREDFIGESFLLAKLLSENPLTQQPNVYALMALICFHSSRSESRLTPEGEIILLPEQDRSKWNQPLIKMGNDYMNQSAFGTEITSYHLEAAIAFEHCSVSNFSETNWVKILQYYESLCAINPSDIARLNKAIATMQVFGASTARQELRGIADKKKLESYYLYYSLLGEIASKLGEIPDAKDYYTKAIGLTLSEREQRIIRSKIENLKE
jgi:RNA polymerase sigma factor (sigma-70 family)